MRKCWNCGVATEDENSRVCSNKICQRAEMRSQRGDFKIKIIVQQHARERAQAKEYRQRPEVKDRERRRKHQPFQKHDAHQRKLMRQMGAGEWSRFLEEE